MSATLVHVDVEIRSGAGYEVADVNFPKRLVTVVAMPYESATDVLYGGRIVTEVVSRGAFDGIEKRAGRIRANRDHSWDKIVGKIVGLHPSRKEGLVTEVKIFGTELGDETLTLCDEGGLDASAGFRLMHRDDGSVALGAQTWERNRTVRRLHKLFLDHVSLVPNPAYPAAVTLDVRTGQERTQNAPHDDVTDEATPILDRLATDALRAQKAALDARWLRPS